MDAVSDFKDLDLPFALFSRDRSIIIEFAGRLSAAHRSRPRRIERALLVFDKYLWPNLHAPVFCGFRFAKEARAYLDLLTAVALPPNQIRIISFAKPDSAEAARWAKLLGWSSPAMKYRHPTNKSSLAARTWIAIEAVFPVTGQSDPKTYRGSRGFDLLMACALQSVLSRHAQAAPERDRRRPFASLEGKVAE